MAEYIRTAKAPNYSQAQAKQLMEKWLAPLKRKDGENPFKLRDQLERVMWRKAGVVRNGKDMAEAIPEIVEIRQKIEAAAGAGAPIYNARWNEMINTVNLGVCAELLTRSALMREESRGAHYRQDFPEKDVKWLKNITVKPVNGDLKWDTVPVKFTRLKPPELIEQEKQLV
jgi:succinate dehydrogenase / fumarate reductase flavoprotein subunit/fumarate reductase flavoprotein subunit